MIAAPPRVPVIQVDYRELRRRVDVAQRSGDTGNVQGAKVLAATFTDFAALTAPRDTNRYLNGWLQAAQDVGATTQPLLPIRDSASAGRIEKVLRRQLSKLTSKIKALETVLERWYYSQGRTGPWQRKKEAELAWLKKRRDRAEEELKEFLGAEGAIAFNLYDAGSGTGRRIATVRTKVYGGAGALIHSGRRVFVRLHNLEAHATLVERKHRIMARGLAVLRQVGVKRAGAAYLEHQARAGGLRLGSGRIVGSKGLKGGFRS